jgi:hypothetical protein
MLEAALIFLGFCFGLIPENLNRKRRLRAHWYALLVEVQMCAEYMETFRTDTIAAPLYRLPTINYQTAFPILLADGVLSKDESELMTKFYNLVEQINRGLDRAGSVRRHEADFAYELASEKDRLNLKIGNTLDAQSDSQSLFTRVKTLIERKTQLKWWQYQSYFG